MNTTPLSELKVKITFPMPLSNIRITPEQQTETLVYVYNFEKIFIVKRNKFKAYKRHVKLSK